MIRAVIDTNVFVSSFLRPASIPGRIRHAWSGRKFELWVSDPLKSEISDVLNRPHLRATFDVKPDEIEKFVNELHEFGCMPVLELLIEPVIAEDPDDDMILATAWATKADCIVSGDAHVLALGSHVGIPIFTPREFLQNTLSADDEIP